METEFNHGWTRMDTDPELSRFLSDLRFLREIIPETGLAKTTKDAKENSE